MSPADSVVSADSCHLKPLFKDSVPDSICRNYYAEVDESHFNKHQHPKVNIWPGLETGVARTIVYHALYLEQVRKISSYTKFQIHQNVLICISLLSINLYLVTGLFPHVHHLKFI